MIKEIDGNVLTSKVSGLRRWKEYLERKLEGKKGEGGGNCRTGSWKD